ncbi:hypothetical protein [Weissella thailandensis]|uniref:hypothetical protein n=1 Tax=Weissella thailandensis TaxID=89061 RepID=UPI0011920711|nr:hypothetical protein [Weissella thailandensis]NKY90295.1 hypothetical protein [Weissella thailandensis]GEP74951.1 hypothetical protein WTH01_11980 [Weissella thailandensis]
MPDKKADSVSLGILDEVNPTKLLNLTLEETGKFDRKTIWITEQALNVNAGFKD